MIPSKLTRVRQDLPWLSPELKRQCHKKQRLYNKWKRVKTAASRVTYNEHYEKVNKALKKARWGYINNILHTASDEGNHKPFWRYVKSQRVDSTGVSPLKKGSEIFSDGIKKAEIIAAQFRSVFAQDDSDANRDTELHSPAYPAISDVTITEVGVAKLLRSLNPSKAGGPDEIPSRLLHHLADELTPSVTSLFQQSYDTGTLPDIWKTAWVTPVFKKGPKCNPANYRPVSLTCILCKLLEHVLSTHIRNHLDQHCILSPSQHGFRKFFSCVSQMSLRMTCTQGSTNGSK